MIQHMTAFPSEDDAFAYFDTLQPVSVSNLVGLWAGRGVPSGHPLDGVLENLGWFGKRFNGDTSADALLFKRGERQLVPLDPLLVPLGVAFRFGRFGRSRVGRSLFSHLARYLRARGPVASLRDMPFRGKTSAAMVYNTKPIVDHFRQIDDDTLLGVMSVEGQSVHYFFRLDRVKADAAP